MKPLPTHIKILFLYLLYNATRKVLLVSGYSVMSVEKRQILPLVKPIIAISICIVIFSITWVLQGQDNQKEAVVENSGVTVQDQVAGTTTSDITNDGDGKDADKDNDTNSTLSELANSVQKATDENQQNANQPTNTDIVNNQLTNPLPVDTIEAVPEKDTQP